MAEPTDDNIPRGRPGPKKALIFTDLHITRAGQTIIGLDPLQRFREALAHALARHGDAERLILLGDLTHTGHPEEYHRLAEVLAACPIPIVATAGNHDDRAHLLAAFPGQPVTAGGYIQAALDLGALRILMLDTHDADKRAPRAGGWLCQTRLDWLEAELTRAEDEGRDVVILCHHPPVDTGFDGMDAIKLSNADAFLAKLRGRPVRHVICGHVHRTIHLSTGGLPVTILKSPCHQMPLILGPGKISDSVDEPGAYGVLLALGPGTIAVHTEDFALSTGEVQTYA